MKPWLKWLISGAHAVILLVLSSYWMNTNYIYGDERVLVQWSSILKRLALKLDNDPPKEDYLFIDLAYEKALIPTEDGLGNEVITDREKLAKFFGIIKRHQKKIKFTVCDVFLQGKSEHDSLLQQSINGVENLVFPNHHREDGQLEELDLNVPQGIADYKMASGGFLKFKLFQDEKLSTIPVHLYEKTTGRTLEDYGILHRDSGTLTLNSVIIDYQIRSHELFEQGEYPVVNLSELLLLPEEVIVEEFLKDRLVLMGDFKSDVHDTVLGPMPGTLILLNAYLTLMSGYHIITWWWLLFMLTGYIIFSRLMLFPDDQIKIRNVNWLGPLLGSLTYLSVMSVMSYLFFNIHIQVLILTLYITLLRFVIKVNQSDWNRTRIKEWAVQLRETYFNFE
jgi:hypothetical protein